MIRILEGDTRDVLRTLDAGSVQCVVTSPPYFGLRDYGMPGQIGQEATPQDFVDAMVQVFGIVRRVLRDDGVVWLNLGDSYASATGSSGASLKSTLATRPTAAKTAAQRDCGTWKRCMGDAKPKDLLMIPARVALALQAPVYVGRIAREIDRVWLAAMVDGEGCFYVHKRPAGQHAGDGYLRRNDTYSPAFEVANTCEAIISRCMQIAGVGSVIRQEKDRRQPIYRWTVRCDEAKSLAREIYPYLVAKQQQCRIICGMPANGVDAEKSWLGMKVLHAGSTTDADFAPPSSCLEPGWFLRSDVIWAKPNPMPESVTDRPTSAHEHVFLLTKRERYFYDAESIREDNAPAYAEPSEIIRRSDAKSDASRHDATSLKASGVNAAKYSGMGRNARNVWTIATQPYSGAHFATMPPDLAELCIRAGSRPGDTILDPFSGAGTTALAADRLQRNAIGIELNPEYAALSRARLIEDAGMFGAVA